jgi:hypothetical protein
MLKSKCKDNEFNQGNVLRLLYDLRASNSVFGWFRHKKNMNRVINSQIAMVQSGKCWEQ